MKDPSAILLIAAMITAVAPPVIASDTLGAFQNSPLGTPVQNGTARVVKIGPSTKYINAEHFESVTIENHRGQRFAWRFDTFIAPTGFPLRRIAPPGFESGSTWIYIEHPAHHIATD
jgi:hypothetical protein